MKKIIFVGLCAFLFSSCTMSYSFTATNNPIGSKTKVGLAETTVTTNGFVLKKTTTVYGE